MPPETPTTIVRSRSAPRDRSLDLVVVFVAHFAADRPLQSHRSHLAGGRFAAAPRPFVEPPRLARGDDRDLVLADPLRGNERCKLRHDTSPIFSRTPWPAGFRSNAGQGLARSRL